MQASKPSLLSNPYFSLLRTAWIYARGERKRYLLVYSMFVVSNLITALKPIIWGLYINELQKQGIAVLSSTWKYVLAYLAIHLGEWLFHGTARVMERKLAFHLSRNFLQELYHKALHLPVRWHQDHHSGATINRIRMAYEALKDFFDTGFMYIHALAKFIFSFAAMIYFSPLFGSVAVLIGILIVFIIFKFDKPFIAAQKEVNEKQHVVSSTLFDSLSNIITVITLRLEKRMESGLMGRVADIFPPFRRKVLVNEWKWFTVDMFVALMYGVILLGYVYQNWVPGETFLIGGLVILMTYVERFTSVFHDIAWQYNQIVSYDTDVKTAQNITETYDGLHLSEQTDALPETWKELQISGLNFSHQETLNGKAVQGLRQIAIRLRRGERIAFIGESGSGKSTLLALLRGLYAGEPGVSVTVDGQPFSKNGQGLSILADHVTLFPQEPEIFENTIEYNISLGLPCETAEMATICDIAHFSEVVAQLPKGLASSIQEKGVNLSGGQKQRLALARGIFAAKDSHIILLDEPTSSVDPKTEAKIYEKLFEAFSDKVIVSSLHRLHLLSRFDYVYVMENGHIADEGSFDHLRQHSPVFQELWQHQEERAEQEV
ncbi:MAG: ABC transporter ATP-binding protein [Saprospiraceae bacterium]|nr:ABC transporter ATP-binding protein [Saprospiraceae bacterium]